MVHTIMPVMHTTEASSTLFLPLLRDRIAQRIGITSFHPGWLLKEHSASSIASDPQFWVYFYWSLYPAFYMNVRSTNSGSHLFSKCCLKNKCMQSILRMIVDNVRRPSHPHTQEYTWAQPQPHIKEKQHIHHINEQSKRKIYCKDSMPK